MNYQIDHSVTIDYRNMTRGTFGPDKAPVVRCHSGETVYMEIGSAFGVSAIDPNLTLRDFCGRFNLDLNSPALAAVVEAGDKLLEGGVEFDGGACGPHILTGPVYVEEAEPGDILKIDILDIDITVPFGYILLRPGMGVLPDKVEKPSYCFVPYDTKKRTAQFLGMELELQPFFGFMGLATDQRLHSVPPGSFGGNLDNKYMCAGSSLYLPVTQPGGLFYVGDGHGRQGNGEVCFTAFECGGLSGVFRFSVIKQKPCRFPMIETADAVIPMGLDRDLNLAMRYCVEETVALLQERCGVSFEDALMCASATIDFEVTQAVDVVQGVHAIIPKKLLADLAQANQH